MATASLVIKFAPHVDEMFSTESKLSMFTNKDFDWIGAHTVRIYKVNTSDMNGYDHPGASPNADHFSPVVGLDVVTEEMPLKKDRSFTFAVDKLDTDETARQLQAATTLVRQQREVVVPEVDSYVYGIMNANAGTEPAAVALTTEGIYTETLKASQAPDDAGAPEAGRVLVVTPVIYILMEKCKDIVMEIDTGSDLHLKGVLATLDNTNVIKVPAVRLPEAFGFLLAHPVVTVTPVKLEDYRIRQGPSDISGALMEGRICYDAFILDNKKEALYHQAVAAQ